MVNGGPAEKSPHIEVTLQTCFRGQDRINYSEMTVSTHKRQNQREIQN